MTPLQTAARNIKTWRESVNERGIYSCEARDEEIRALRAAIADEQAQQLAVPQPVARVDSWTNGSYSRNYKITWLENVPEGTLLYAAAQGAKT